MKTAGIALLSIGLIMTFYTGYTYATREKVVDFGEFEITAENQHTMHWEPYAGMAIMVLGGALLAFDRKRSTSA